MSCIAEKLKHYLDLTEEERKTLNKLEEQQQHFKRRAIVQQQGDPAEHLYVVKEGWVAAYTQLHDGSRFIQNLYFPGDIVNSMGIGATECIHGLFSVTSSTLCPFPKHGLQTVFQDFPRLTALLYAVGMQENVVLTDRLKAIGGMPGKNRVALLILQVHARLKAFGNDVSDGFAFELSQEVIGDAVGITTVYANRVLKQLKDDGWIAIDKRKVWILEEKKLENSCDFVDRYYQLDTSWFPESGA